MELNASLFRFSLLLLFSPLCIGGGLGFLATYAGLRRRREMENWPLVQASVIDTEVRQSEYRGTLGSRETAWDLLVNFTFHASGRERTAQVSLEVEVPRGGRHNPEVVDEAVAAVRYRLGDGFGVRVDPADPDRVALPVEHSNWIYFRLTMFGATTVVSLVALVLAFSS